MLGVALDITERKQTEAALEENYQRFITLAENMPVMINAVNADGSFTYWNKACETLTGYSAAEIIDNPEAMALLYPDPHYREQLSREWREVQGHFDNKEIKLHSKDGSEHLVLWTNLPASMSFSGDDRWAIGVDITAIRQAEAEHAMFAAFVQNSTDIIAIKDRNSRVLAANLAFARAAARASLEELIGKTDAEIFNVPPSAQSVHSYHHDDLNTLSLPLGKVLIMEQPVLFPDNETRIFLTKKFPIRNDAGEAFAIGIIASDITAQKHTERALRASQDKFKKMFYNAPLLMSISNVADGRILEVNDVFIRVTGFTPAQVIGKTSTALGFISPAERARLTEQLHRNGRIRELEIETTRADGSRMICLYSAELIEIGQQQRLLSIAIDITKRKKMEAALQHIAHFDALTDLPNRVLFTDRLEQAMRQVARRQEYLALVFIDLDGFKAINDSHGHAAGDQLLITIAARMRQSLREEDTIARLGGDEFIVLLMDVGDCNRAIPWLERLLAATREPVYLNNLGLQVSASIGVAFYPQSQPVTALHLIQQADQAMYQAKLAGKNRYRFFTAA
mgnify:CR=1 FL=1